MSFWKMRSLLAMVALVLGSILLVSCGGGEAAEGPPGTNFFYRDGKLEPERLTVKVGTKITWINRDGTPHTVTEVNNDTYKTPKEGGFDSPALQNNQKFEYTFDKPGTYYFKDRNYPKLFGEIIVEP